MEGAHSFAAILGFKKAQRGREGTAGKKRKGGERLQLIPHTTRFTCQDEILVRVYAFRPEEKKEGKIKKKREEKEERSQSSASLKTREKEGKEKKFGGKKKRRREKRGGISAFSISAMI